MSSQEYDGWRQYSVHCARCHGQDVLPNPVAANLLISLGPGGPIDSPEKFADELEALGPTFVKLGQMLSTRPDLVPPAYASALERMQEKVAPVPFEVIRESTSVLLPSLLAGRFSAAIIHLPVDDPELMIEPLFAEDLVVVAHSEHPLAASAELPLA